MSEPLTSEAFLGEKEKPAGMEPAICLLAGELIGEKNVGRKQVKEFLLGDLRLAIARGNQGIG